MARNRNGRYDASYRDRYGAVKWTKTFPTAKAADAAAHAARALEMSGVDAKAALRKPTHLYADTRRGKVTVNGYAPVYLEQAEIRDTSRESYDAVMRKHVIGHLGDVPMTELTPVMVREFLAAMKRKGVSAATRGSALKVLRAMCQAAVQDELLTRNPTAGMKVSDQQAAERQVLTPAEADRLLDALPGWARLLVQTALDTGCRWGELLAIRPDDVVQGVDGVWTLRIRRTMEEVGSKLTERSCGKTPAAMRDVVISPELAADLRAAAPGNGLCFRAERGGDLIRANFRRTLHAACRRAGVPLVSAHCFRHTHISWLVNSPGWGDTSPTAVLVQVGRRVGHRDMQTTLQYVHVDPAKKANVLSALATAKAA